MGLKILYSKIAQQDLREIYNYIRKNSLYYANNERKLIVLTISKLEFNPLLGKVFEYTEAKSSRELIFKNYRIIYDVISGSHINILSIHHHARLISNNPAFKDDE